MTDTQVKFGLWPILVFLFLSGVSSFTFLYAEGKETKIKQQDMIQRVVILETVNRAILDGINRLEQGQKEMAIANNKVADALNNHERATRTK